MSLPDSPDQRRAGSKACNPSLVPSSDVRSTQLPGIGYRHEFTAADGETVGVVRHRDGDRELIVFSRDDPDACRLSLRLSGQDARVLATLLGEERPDNSR